MNEPIPQEVVAFDAATWQAHAREQLQGEPLAIAICERAFERRGKIPMNEGQDIIDAAHQKSLKVVTARFIIA